MPTPDFQSIEGREALLLHYTEKYLQKSHFWHILEISFKAISLAHIKIFVFLKHVKLLVHQNFGASKMMYSRFSRKWVPILGPFCFKNSSKTHFREYPFSRIPILSVVKVSELKTPFPLFSETHFRKFEKVAFYEKQIWTFMNKTKHPEHKTNKLPLDKRTWEGKTSSFAKLERFLRDFFWRTQICNFTQM